jgi:anti-sigma B factor antagonist
MSFTFEHKKQDDIAFISPQGDLIEKAQAQPILEQVDEYIDDEVKKFIVDMTNVRYLNSSGLNALISLLTKARKSGGEVIISNLSPKVKDLLIITRLNTVFTVTDSVQEAQEKLTSI